MRSNKGKVLCISGVILPVNQKQFMHSAYKWRFVFYIKADGRSESQIKRKSTNTIRTTNLFHFFSPPPSFFILSGALVLHIRTGTIGGEVHSIRFSHANSFIVVLFFGTCVPFATNTLQSSHQPTSESVSDEITNRNNTNSPIFLG